MSVHSSAIHHSTPRVLLNGFLATGAVIACLMLPHQARADNWNGNRHIEGRSIASPQFNRHDNGNHNIHWRNGNDRRYDVRNVYVPQRQIVYYYPTQYYPVYTPVRYEPVRPVHLVGDRLVNCQPVPQHILYRLQPAPRGYYYGYRDNNVYLLRQNDNVITQIISALLN